MTHEAIALWTETSSDPELIAGVRAGDGPAFGVLYERHVDAARKVAAQYTNSPSDVDDVVSEAFSKVLRALQQGDGPDLAFRAYLFTIVRRTGMEVINRANRTRPGDDMAQYEQAIGYDAPSDEGTLAGFEQGIVADAFRSLPERWQAVLWYTEVEKKSPKEIAPLLGLTANGVAALAYRAREALRQAYLQQHLSSADSMECLAASAQLGAYVRGGLAKREHAKVEDHVRGCDTCTALVAELEDVNRGMRGVIAPLVLGVAGLRALEGGLPIGGAFGPHGAVAGGAGAAAGGSAGAVGSGFAGWIASAASVVLPAAAAIGVVALAVSGASFLGVFDPLAKDLGQDPAGPPTTAEPTSGSTAEPTAAPTAQPSAQPSPAPGPTHSTGPSEGSIPRHSSAPRHLTGPVTKAEPTHTSQPSPNPEPTTDPEPTADPATSPEPTADPGTEPGGNEGTGNDSPNTDDDQPDPAPRAAVLAFGEAPLGILEISAAAPQVQMTLANTGDGDAADVTASITLPDGLTFARPPGGAGALSPLPTARLANFLSFATDGTFAVGEWTCTLGTLHGSAQCTLAQLPASSQSQLTLDLTPIADATYLDADAWTRFEALSGDVNAAYSMRTTIERTERNLTGAFAKTGHLGVTQVGTTVMGCNVSTSACASVMGFTGTDAKPSLNNNDQKMAALNPAGGYHNSGTTTLGEQFLPAGATVTYALLEWSANRYQGDVGWTGDTASARFKTPGGDYQALTADAVAVHLDDARYYYQARADVTALVAAAGNGDYSLADIALPASSKDPVSTYYGGFSLTVVYELDSLPTSRVAIFTGSQWIKDATGAPFSLYADATADVTIGWTAWEADRGTNGDHVSLDHDDLQPYGWSGSALLPHDSGNAADATAFGSPFANTLGVDAKSFVTKTAVPEGMHTLRAWTGGDNYLIGSLSVTITVGE